MDDGDSNSSPSNDLDTHIIERLRLAKSIYDHALEHSSRTGRLDRLIAIHGFHLSAEIVLKAILQKETPLTKYGGYVTFPALLKDASDLREGKSPTGAYQGYLRGLNDLRNLAQHAASTPDEAVVTEYRAIVRAFLVDTYRAHFGLDFDQISDADLIFEPRIKSLLKEAEEQQRRLDALIGRRLENGDKTEDEIFKTDQVALAMIEAAFALACRQVLYTIEFAEFRDLQEPPDSLGLLPDDNNPEATMALIWRRVRHLEVSSLLSHIGVDYLLFQELLEHSPSVRVADAKMVFVDPRNEAPADPGRLDRLTRFVVGCILGWQEQGLADASALAISDPGDPFIALADTVARGDLPDMIEALPMEEFRRGSMRTAWLPHEL